MNKSSERESVHGGAREYPRYVFLPLARISFSFLENLTVHPSVRVALLPS